MSVYAQHVSRKITSQSQPIPGTAQVANSAGGFAWKVDCWTRLDRFLILGNEKGSYYASEREMTLKNVSALDECATADAARTVNRIAEVSEGGRAPKNDPAVFALAYLVGNKGPASALALNALPRVCRIGTHLFQFAETVNSMRGWGRCLRSAVGNWYLTKEPRDLAYQLVKYQQRNGWSHRDMLRLSHPKADGPVQSALRWAVGKEANLEIDTELKPIVAMEKAKRATSANEIVGLIRDYRLVRECIPTQFLNDPNVWAALLDEMPITAMVRSLGKLSAVGLLAPLSATAKLVTDRLNDVERLKHGRVHPISLLIAQKVYAQGRGEKGKLSWTPVTQIIDALDSAFYKAFAAVEPTGKRWFLALDVSGSMESGSIAGTSLTPRDASAAMALVTAATEPQYMCAGFTNGSYRSRWGNNYGSGLSPLTISPRMRLRDAVSAVSNMPFGGTDCAIPMIEAKKNKWPVDVFVVYTDSETWAGSIHPSQALDQYRQATGIGAKLIVCGMVANDFSIADTNDPGMMDVVGFDATVPQVMANFA